MDLDAPVGNARPAEELFDADDPGSLPGVDVNEDDILAILYTSGTTGKPKGATITHRQALANLQNLALLNTAASMQGKGLRDPGQAASLLVVPLFHVTGALSTMVTAFAAGSKLVLMPPGKFDPDHAMATIEREQVTSIGGVPTVMWRIVEAPSFDQYDLSSVSRIGYGGAPAAPELVERIKAAFPQGARHAVHRVRPHRDGVGRDRERRGGLLQPPRFGRPSRAHGRGPDHRRRRHAGAARRDRRDRAARARRS